MKTAILTLLIMLLLSAGCSERKPDGRLARIAGFVSDSPEEALSSLDSIDRRGLSEADRHFYDLLRIKAEDKAYVSHVSDSTILRVIDYYSSHGNGDLLTEALYYGGRVYSDIGDSPTALQYFHKALDNFPEGHPDLDLKANILSQTGRLLNGLSLYDEAVPYIEQSIEIDKVLGDTVGMVYDIQLLGGTYLRDKKFRLAEHYFNQALDLSFNLPTSFKAKSRMYLAALKYKEGKLDSALVLMRGTLDLVEPISRNSALAYASKIYLHKELLDTAYAYAHELMHNRDSTNMESGYQVLLSPKLRGFIPPDTLDRYISDYRGLLESYYDRNMVQLSINRQNFYNYQRHEEERKKAETHSRNLTKWIFGVSALCLVLVIAVLYYKNQNHKTVIRLHVALDTINELYGNISADRHNKIPPGDNNAETADDSPDDRPTDDGFKASGLLTSKAEMELRDKLREKLLSLYNSGRADELDAAIAGSGAYRKLQELIVRKQTLEYGNPLWGELESVVTESSPNFKDNLQLLTQSRMTDIDFHTALLVKCHVLPMQMAVLLGRTKGAIVSRRDSLCLKIFDEKLGTKVIDGIIRLL